MILLILFKLQSRQIFTDYLRKALCVPKQYCSITHKSPLISQKSDCRLSRKSCGLSEHVIELDHEMNSEQVKILTREKNKIKHLFLEMTHIGGNVKH